MEQLKSEGDMLLKIVKDNMTVVLERLKNIQRLDKKLRMKQTNHLMKFESQYRLRLKLNKKLRKNKELCDVQERQLNLFKSHFKMEWKVTL